jgi:uncharacterized protein
MAIEPTGRLTRRAFATGAAGMLARASAEETTGSNSILSAWSDGKGADERHWAGRVGERGVLLNERAHQVVRDPRSPRWAWAVARRPGEWLWRLDLHEAVITQAAALDDEQRFEGHLCLSRTSDGDVRHLYTTESATGDGAGFIVQRDPVTLRTRDAWHSGGIGPHEVLRCSTHVMAVANGGLQLEPETGRAVRNFGTVQSNVSWLDERTGRTLDCWPAPRPGLSLRHLARATDGTVAVAMQKIGPVMDEALPLVVLRRPGSRHWTQVEGSEALWRSLLGYAGAIASAGNCIVATFPHADAAVAWHASGKLLARIHLAGVCGVCPWSPGWLLSGDQGNIWTLHASSLVAKVCLQRPGLRLDNHLG